MGQKICWKSRHRTSRRSGPFVTEEEQLFMDFKGSDIYQVNISTIRARRRLRISTAATEPSGHRVP
ncbi:MAG: hypothetical protein IPL27_27730 [Lewinellaceae bacterium]|nr:hypothetical protein [Lewinellaceae bacterium]